METSLCNEDLVHELIRHVRVLEKPDLSPASPAYASAHEQVRRLRCELLDRLNTYGPDPMQFRWPQAFVHAN